MSTDGLGRMGGTNCGVLYLASSILALLCINQSPRFSSLSLSLRDQDVDLFMESQTVGHKYARGSVSGVIEDCAVMTVKASERDEHDGGDVCILCIRNTRRL